MTAEKHLLPHLLRDVERIGRIVVVVIRRMEQGRCRSGRDVDQAVVVPPLAKRLIFPDDVVVEAFEICKVQNAKWRAQAEMAGAIGGRQFYCTIVELVPNRESVCKARLLSL